MGIFFFSIYQSIVAVLMYCKNHLNAQYIATHVMNAVANVFTSLPPRPGLLFWVFVDYGIIIHT